MTPADGGPVSGRPLRITWVLPFLRFTGGIRVVYEHARELIRRGHDVTIVAPRDLATVLGPRSLLDRARDSVVDLVLEPIGSILDFYGLGRRVLRVDRLDPSLFPDADVVLATSWHTAASVAAAAPRSGRPAYFIQSYEAFEPGLEEAVDATWRLPMERIVIATWIARLARERFDVPVWGPIVNGVDLELFHDRGRIENPAPVVGMLYDRLPLKGADDGFSAMRQARQEIPELRLQMYGRPRMRHELGSLDRYEQRPRPRRLSAFYRECDLFLSPSWLEGCQLPPMEAMASRCAVVATAVGGIPDYAIAGVTALTGPPHEPAFLARHLVTLARDRALREAMATAGRNHIRNFTWERATGQLEEILRAILDGQTAS